MEQVILVCDWCPGVRKHAVAKYALTNGRGPKPVAGLDLCASHQRELLKLVQPRGKRREKVPPAARGRGSRGITGGKILDYLRGQRKPVTRQAIMEALKLTGNQATNALVQLRKEKKAKMGGAGRARIWSVA